MKPDRYKMTVRISTKEVVENAKNTRKRTKNKTVRFVHIVHRDHTELRKLMDAAKKYYVFHGYCLTDDLREGLYMVLTKISNEREFIANFDHKLVDSKHSSVNIPTY